MSDWDLVHQTFSANRFGTMFDVSQRLGHFYDSIDTGFKSNPKRLWSILKLNSKSHHIPDLVSMATSPETTADQPHNPPRKSAGSPAGIAALFYSFFASVFTVEEITCEPSDTVMVDLNLTVTTVQTALEALEVGKATGPDEITATVFIRISAQPRISAHPKGRKS